MQNNKIYNDNHTFVICAYKESKYLKRTLESLLNQTVSSKIVVVTSTYNDYIKKICEYYNVELKVQYNHVDIASDWNYAYDVANTNLVTICHQDDIYSKDYLYNILNELKDSNNPIIIFTDYIEMHKSKIVKKSLLLFIKRLLLKPLLIKVLRKKRFIKRRVLSFGNPICCPTVTFVKNKIKEEPFKSGYKSNIDWQTWEKLSRTTGEFIYCNKKLVIHRIHEDSTTTKLINNGERIKEDYSMFLKFWPKIIAKLLTKIYIISEKSNS